MDEEEYYEEENIEQEGFDEEFEQDPWNIYIWGLPTFSGPEPTLEEDFDFSELAHCQSTASFHFNPTYHKFSIRRDSQESLDHVIKRIDGGPIRSKRQVVVLRF